ncbi:unnamed protein product [Brassica napus]|uniref:(rape) hypothetical protein n=1 Tax=Brassica napus TaxID=3708 RepID=A0A817B3R6_BRANA|nr:unnamed protein product [Brassica napus]
MNFTSAVSVGSEIYFLHGCPWPARSLWFFDTRSGTLQIGPSMRNARLAREEAVGVVDGKIYVIGGSVDESQVEVFDPETQTGEFAGEEKVQCKSRFSASLEDRVYMVDPCMGESVRILREKV